MKNESGSAHAIVIVALVLALIGALGWIFYQNFVMDGKNEESVTSPVSDVTKNSAKTKECLSIEKLCFDYPSDWSVEITTRPQGEGVPMSDLVTIKNPVGQAVLSLDTGVSGVGGACDPATIDTTILNVIEVKKTAVTTEPRDGNDTGVVYAVKAIYHDDAKGYQPFMYLSSTRDKIGEVKNCLPGLDALYSSRNVENSSVNFVNTSNKIGSDSSSDYLQTKDEAAALLDSNDYRLGFQILSSARY